MFKWLAAAATTTVGLPLTLGLLVAADPGTSVAGAGVAGGPSVVAVADIPPAYLALYLSAARTCPGLPWGVLAGIGKVESDHGRAAAPGVHSGANFARAEGPMQFEPATFAQYAVKADPGAPLSPYNPADAIYTAAAMLCADGAASGADAGIRQAIFAYNTVPPGKHGSTAARARPVKTAHAATPGRSRIRDAGTGLRWTSAPPLLARSQPAPATSARRANEPPLCRQASCPTPDNARLPASPARSGTEGADLGEREPAHP